MATMAIPMETTQTMRAVVRRRWGRPHDVVELDEVAKPTPKDGRGARTRTRVVREPRRLLRARRSRSADAPHDRRLPAAEGRARGRRLRRESPRLSARTVTDVQPGDEVYGVRTGAFAQYVSAKLAVARKPANVSFEEAAAVPIAGLTALEAVVTTGGSSRASASSSTAPRAASAASPSKVAKALGAGHVTAVCSARNVERARALGADTVLDYAREDYTRSGEHYDLIVDVAGTHSWRQNLASSSGAGPSCWRDCRRATTSPGRWAVSGSSGSRPGSAAGAGSSSSSASRTGPTSRPSGS
jgi:NADPH:quinone reductase and related Zn-dependent oxidoreductases